MVEELIVAAGIKAAEELDALAVDGISFARVTEAVSRAIHPTAAIAEDVKIAGTASVGANSVLEKGAQIEDMSKLGTDIRVGAGSYVSGDIGNIVKIGENTRIGTNADGAFVKDGVTIGNHGLIDRFVTLDERVTVGDFAKIHRGVWVSPDAQIGNNVEIFNNAQIGPGVKIGDGATIGRWATVSEHVPAGARVPDGVPPDFFSMVENRFREFKRSL